MTQGGKTELLKLLALCVQCGSFVAVLAEDAWLTIVLLDVVAVLLWVVVVRGERG